MKQNIFVETANVSAFRKALGRLCGQERFQPSFMVVQGRSGRGKSLTAINWHAAKGCVFLQVWEGWSQHALLQALALETTGGQPHGVDNCKRAVVEMLTIEPRPLIIDEADRLKIERLEDLRDISEATGVPVVLIGEEGFLPRLKARARIYSRVAELVEFGPVAELDVMAYAQQAASLLVNNEAAAALAKHAGGSFRLIHTYVARLEEAAQVNNLAEISLETLKLAGLAGTGGRR